MPLDNNILERLQAFESLPKEGGSRIQPTAELTAALDALSAPVGNYRAPSVAIESRSIPGPHGDIPVRMYRPSGGEGSGIGLVWMHGGAFLSGDLEMPEADITARELADRVGAVVISVDYRLARGGIHFPVPHDDVHAAFLWTVAASADLQMRDTAIALGGASAGGNLAAGVCLRLRDEGAPTPALLMLAYPVLHDEMPAFDGLPQDISILPAALAPSADESAFIIANFLGHQLPTPYAFPGRGDLAGLPRTVILTSEYDHLRASANQFARDLRAAEVCVSERCEPSVIHGHLNIPGLAGSERSVRFLADELAALAGA